jgi:hypothetical protein
VEKLTSYFLNSENVMKQEIIFESLKYGKRRKSPSLKVLLFVRLWHLTMLSF